MYRENFTRLNPFFTNFLFATDLIKLYVTYSLFKGQCRRKLKDTFFRVWGFFQRVRHVSIFFFHIKKILVQLPDIWIFREFENLKPRDLQTTGVFTDILKIEPKVFFWTIEDGRFGAFGKANPFTEVLWMRRLHFSRDPRGILWTVNIHESRDRTMWFTIQHFIGPVRLVSSITFKKPLRSVLIFLHIFRWPKLSWV